MGDEPQKPDEKPEKKKHGHERPVKKLTNMQKLEKQVEENRIKTISNENRIGQINTAGYDFLIDNITRLSLVNQNYVQSFNLQQKYFEEKGLKEDYMNWVTEETKKNMKQHVPGVEDDGKIKRVSEIEAGEGQSGKPNKPDTGGAKGENKDSTGANESGDGRTPTEPEPPEQTDSSNAE